MRATRDDAPARPHGAGGWRLSAGRKAAIMQPYFFPYIGYFQLLAAVDLFIVYDNIKYTKKGWINRNRMLRDGNDVVFSLPLKNEPDHLDVRERSLAADFSREKLLNQLRGAYSKAPMFEDVHALLERVIRNPVDNLFSYLHSALVSTAAHMNIPTEIRISSNIDIDHGLKGQDKVIALARAVGATDYINPIGGTELYSKEIFADQRIRLSFLRSRPIEYAQFGKTFVPWLSIIDVLMFNSVETVGGQFLKQFDLL
jgi:hypothetical protein